MEKFKYFTVFEITALLIGLLLAIHFYSLKKNQHINKNLGLFLFLSTILGVIILPFELFNIHVPFIYYFETNIFATPFLYFYAKNLNSKKNIKSSKIFVIPIIIFILHFTIYSFNLSRYTIITLFCLEHLCIHLYCIYILRKTYKIILLKENQLNQYFSNMENKTLKWLRKIIIIIIGLHCYWLFADIFYTIVHSISYLDNISSILTVAVIYFIAYKSIRHPAIFFEIDTLNSQLNNKLSNINKPILSENDELIFDRINHILDTDKLYKNKNLNLRQLAEAIETTDKTLSRIINTKTGNNFFHLINSRRIECFNNKIVENPDSNLTLFALGEECGFKSKSTFYAVYKKLEGLTPNEFVKKIKSDQKVNTTKVEPIKENQ